LDYHLDRLTASATLFNKRNEGFEHIPAAKVIEERLKHIVPLGDGPQRVNITRKHLLSTVYDIDLSV
jgi:hypothetical protein